MAVRAVNAPSSAAEKVAGSVNAPVLVGSYPSTEPPPNAYPKRSLPPGHNEKKLGLLATASPNTVAVGPLIKAPNKPFNCPYPATPMSIVRMPGTE